MKCCSFVFGEGFWFFGLVFWFGFCCFCLFCGFVVLLCVGIFFFFLRRGGVGYLCIRLIVDFLSMQDRKLWALRWMGR